jgi:hypothetical protein
MQRSFGCCWDTLKRPVLATVGALDPELMPQIGLSAMQLQNLDLSTNSPPGGVRELAIMVETNRKRIPDHRRYGKVVLTKNGKSVEVFVYNAFGLMSLPDGGIRVSKGAADALNLTVNDRVEIS